eukprot:10807415-Karenia_brevis.AAC.1
MRGKSLELQMRQNLTQLALVAQRALQSAGQRKCWHCCAKEMGNGIHSMQTVWEEKEFLSLLALTRIRGRSRLRWHRKDSKASWRR